MRKYGFLFISLTILFNPVATAGSGYPQGSLKIITYNIWNGFDWGKDQARHGRFVKWVRQQAPDVLALQELCGYTEEKLQADAAEWGHAYSVLLKTDGYPVGITSNQPIELKEKLLEGLWHGMLHVKTHGIDFFVVHLSPADYAFRMREMAIVTEKIRAIDKDAYIVLGDFNAVSPLDSNLYTVKTSLLERYRRSDESNERYNNLRNGEWDYAVMSGFLALPAIDVCHRLLSATDLYSFPTPALIGQYYDDAAHVERSALRIDYIMASPELARRCTGAAIFHDEITEGLSDHYPVGVEIEER
jgi:endonuclease/exonuclease/phosphatase family metal-dependent hydrolase